MHLICKCLVLFLCVKLGLTKEIRNVLEQGVDPTCEPKIHDEIANYSQVVKNIFDYVSSGEQRSKTFSELARFVDKFGPRIAGSTVLEQAIDYMVDLLKGFGLDDVHTETAQVPHWVRGNESAWMLEPRPQRLAMLGLGGSVGTGPQGITAEVLVVRTFDELHKKGPQAQGKIVVFNQDWVDYGTSVQYRDYAAVESAKLGGLATLVRSIAPFSIHSPHTGWQDYQDNVTQVPAACIAIEDAEMLQRMSDRGDKIVINIKMEAQNLPPAMSRNTVADLKGSLYPDQYVLVSGHLDSWDVGQGAMDDGAGAFIAWRALDLLKGMGLRPKRTLRSVLWTGEEEGWWGALAFFNAHKQDKDKYSMVMESDGGTFYPRGLTFSGTNQNAKCVIQEVLSLFKFLNATQLQYSQEGPDITYWMQAGVPGASLLNDADRYFYFHHSDGDTMTVEDPKELDLCTAFWAATAYIIADIQDMIPR